MNKIIFLLITIIFNIKCIDNNELKKTNKKKLKRILPIIFEHSDESKASSQSPDRLEVSNGNHNQIEKKSSLREFMELFCCCFNKKKNIGNFNINN